MTYMRAVEMINNFGQAAQVNAPHDNMVLSEEEEEDHMEVTTTSGSQNQSLPHAEPHIASQSNHTPHVEEESGSELSDIEEDEEDHMEYQPTEYDDSEEALLKEIGYEGLYGRAEEESEEMNEIAEVNLHLPPVVVDPNHFEETQRQISMQLRGLNQLSAKQWLVNVLLNRMKPAEEQISQRYRTKQGKLLAQKIDHLLIENDHYARLLMEEIVLRMHRLHEVLSNMTKTEHTKQLIEQIVDAAHIAAGSENTYLVFRHLNGQENMQVLTRMGVFGGLGRQHGAGDEKDFRERYHAGIELLKMGDPTMKHNACLHNPDQCAGGPMAITWLPGSTDALNHAQAQYNNTLKTFKRLLKTLESYKQIPPTTEEGKAQMQKIQKEFNFTRSVLREATLKYMGAVSNHLGNYDVNSQLGKAWMQGGFENHINRIDMILSEVLQIPIDQLEETSLNIQMDTYEDQFGYYNTHEFDDPHVPTEIYTDKAPEDRKIKKNPNRTKTDERLEKALNKGPRQTNFDDMGFQLDQEQNRPMTPIEVMIALGRTQRGALYILDDDDWAEYNAYKQNHPNQKFTR